MIKGKKPPLELLRERLAYDPATGAFTWRAKPISKPTDVQWNSRFAGKPAGAPEAGYLRIGLKFGGKVEKIFAHQIAWVLSYGRWPTEVIDHINSNQSDNRLCNLREATSSQNVWHQGIQSRNTSGAKGVTYFPRLKRWRARIAVKRQRICLGTFATVQEARAAYCEAARKLHGEFAYFE